MDAHTARAVAPQTGQLPTSNALPSGTRLREFELLDALGEGGFSIVYAARERQLARDVAIKEYIPTALAGRGRANSVCLRSERHRDTFNAGMHGFINEARLLAQFSHPALVKVLQFWEENGTAYMVMPRYHGKTLRWVLSRFGERCNERWLRGILSPMLDVLELLHSQNVFHRDVAPDNILIREDGSPVLLDLGSAREIVTELQDAVTVVVKPGYTPIEQYSGDFSLPQGPWTDIYAVGALLYFAVVGSAPAASISRIMKDTKAPLAERVSEKYSAAFLQAIDKALALQPADRQQTIAELRADLGITASDKITLLTGDEDFASLCQTDAAASGDDARTAIVPAEEVAKVLQHLMSHGRGTAPLTATAPVDLSGAAGNPAPDPFIESQQANKPAEPEFADMQELLEGAHPTPAKITIPVIPHAVQAQQSASQSAKPGNTRAWPTSIAISVLILIAVGMFFSIHWLSGAQDRDQDQETAITRIQAQDDAPDQAATGDETIKAAAILALQDLDLQPTDIDSIAVHDDPSGAVPSAASTMAAALIQPAPIALMPNADAGEHSHDSSSAPTNTRGRNNQRASADTTAPVDNKATAETGEVRVQVQPWAEVWVDGKKYGVSPPLLHITLPVGKHALELRNANLAPYKRAVTVNAQKPITVEHRFTAEAKPNGS